jgi:hypothetical protein
VPRLDDLLNAFERTIATTDALDEDVAAHFMGRVALYRTLVAGIKQLSLESSKIWQDGRRSRSSNVMFFERQAPRAG